MKYGVIDIGSNTMRTVVYDVTGNEFVEIINEKEFVELISYVEDGVLSEGGIERLAGVVQRMGNLCHVVGCAETFCFATASLRYITNQEEVIAEVYKASGIAIELLSGCDEAYYDYVGLKNVLAEDEATGFDLGGGSGQIFYYKKDQLVKSRSHPMGCLQMYNTCVRGVFPTSKERAKIVKTIKKFLKEDGAFAKKKPETIYGMGGTARACAKLHKHLIGADQSIDLYTLTLADLEELDTVVTGLGLGGIKILNRVIPERLCTIIPGILTIQVIMRHIGAEKLTVLKHGIREGYILENAIHKRSGLNGMRDSQQSVCQ